MVDYSVESVESLNADSDDWNGVWDAEPAELAKEQLLQIENDPTSEGEDDFEIELVEEETPQPSTPQVIYESSSKPESIDISQPQSQPHQEIHQESTPAAQEPKTPAKEELKTTTPPNKPSGKPVVLEKCATSADCQEDQFCVVKVGKCVKKFQLGGEGCSKHEQCAGEGVACVQQGKVRKCIQACTLDGNACGSSAYCAADKSAVKGLKGNFAGICRPGKAPKSGKEIVSSAVSKGNSFLGPVAIVAAFLVVVTIGFIWIRSYLKRRHMNHDPSLFQFKPPLTTYPQTASQERLDMKLMKMSGARYTVWAPMSNK